MCLDSDSGRDSLRQRWFGSNQFTYRAGPDSPYADSVPINDNRKWALDIIAEALLLGNTSKCW